MACGEPAVVFVMMAGDASTVNPKDNMQAKGLKKAYHSLVGQCQFARDVWMYVWEAQKLLM